MANRQFFDKVSVITHQQQTSQELGAQSFQGEEICYLIDHGVLENH